MVCDRRDAIVRLATSVTVAQFRTLTSSLTLSQRTLTVLKRRVSLLVMFSSALSEDRARLANIEAHIFHLECSLSQLPLIPGMLGGFGADRARIADMEDEIRYLERVLSQLRSETTLVQERIKSYKYPVLSLPRDLASEIFIHFALTFPHGPPLGGRFSPTTLTQVCHDWREIALATPQLWKGIRLGDNALSVGWQREIVDTWLSRSSGCPISIFIRGHFEKPAALLDFRPRLEHLELRHVQANVYPILNDLLPELRSLDLALCPGDNIAVRLHHAPLLRTACFDGAAAIILQRTGFPLQRFTSLTLYELHPSECRAVLHCAPQLVYCNLEFWPGDDDDLPGWRNRGRYAPDAYLRRLESLILTDVRQRRCTMHGRSVLAGKSYKKREESDIRGFVCPSLRLLRIPEKSLGEDPVYALRSFISRSHCKRLREVHITGSRSVSSQSYRKRFDSTTKFTFEGHSHSR
ncbi:hypothetical protein C8R47DRAFT_420557 [Mycena vitilis]|nr:hypothetical protein C8R47DRAFT_420557 [Mycena vitilis]